MADAQVPPEAGDAKSALARRQALRLSDAEDVAATRLDMFGDPMLKEALASPAPGASDEALPPSAAEAAGEPLPPADAGQDGVRPVAPEQPLPEVPLPALLLPPYAEPGLDAAVHPQPLAAPEHPAALTPPPEPYNGTQGAGEFSPLNGRVPRLKRRPPQQMPRPPLLPMHGTRPRSRQRCPRKMYAARRRLQQDRSACPS